MSWVILLLKGDVWDNKSWWLRYSSNTYRTDQSDDIPLLYFDTICCNNIIDRNSSFRDGIISTSSRQSMEAFVQADAIRVNSQFLYTRLIFPWYSAGAANKARFSCWTLCNLWVWVIFFGRFSLVVFHAEIWPCWSKAYFCYCLGVGWESRYSSKRRPWSACTNWCAA